MISPAGGGPFSTPVWRIGTVSQLVESGGEPYWLVRNPDSGRDEYVPIPVLDSFTIAQSVLLVLALTVASENCRQVMLEHHNLVKSRGQLKLAACWDLSDEEISLVLKDLQKRVRLGVVVLDEESILTPAALEHLQSWDLQVDTFH